METKNNAIEIEVTPQKLLEMGWTVEEYEKTMAELEKASEGHLRAKARGGQ